MGESPKRRKSLWDEEPPHSPDCEEWGPSKADNSRQSKNNSGWSYGDGVTGEEELRKENYHYKSMSPDRWGRRSNSHSPDNSRTQSRRYHGRGRSRSRSRERREGRSRSPSRGRDRTGDWSRSRDRDRDWDRDRDRDRGTIRGQNRSRSPLNNPKRDPYSSSDRRSGPPVPQVCRNFAVGNCRRGSDCRFFHPDSANNRDRDHSEDSLAERLGSRSERGHISRYADRDMHHVEDEVHRNRSKGTIVCRDFVKGNCRWGASCRFSHDGDSYDKGTRSESDFDPGGQDNQASSRSAKSLCKYFAAGKCFKDNCKFSHERNEEVRASDSHRFDDRNTNWMNGPKWDNEERREHSDLIKTSGWDESSVRKDAAVTVLTDRTNERLGHSFENESRAWGSTVVPQFMNSDRDRGVSPHRGCVGNLSGSLNMSESSGLQNFTNIQEIHPSQVSVQNIDRTSELVLGHNSNQEASVVVQSGAASQPYGSASSIDGIATLGSNALNDFLNGTHQIGLPGQSFIGADIGMVSEHSGILNGTQQEPNVFLPIPPSSKREAPNTPEMLELKVPQNLSTAVTTEEKVHQMKTSPESMMKAYEEAHLQSAFNSSCPSGMLPSNAISSLLETIYAKTKPSDSLGLITPGNFKMPPDNLSCLDNKEQLIQSSLVDPVPGNNVQTDEVKQQEKTSAEVDGKDKLVPDESNDHQGAMDMHGKVEEGGGNKDEKVMRLFKNALIEFVKEILKPTWKEGRMSREVHKTVVKKAVDKVTSTIPVDQMPRTQEKIEQYLAFSKPKITKLVQAYVERYLKNEA